MAKARVTVSIDEDVLRAVRVRAARAGTTKSAVVEAALRRDLGFDLLDRQADEMGEDAAIALAIEAQQWARRRG
jgi:Arc/MetJ family transcription regulator